ncbi:MAG TPA: glutathione S-transferase family protein [Stellaceae bacterium]|jgi:glutathione S-transferase|nr:glutathione S-transferase family protein [Stellaceae bacterium]
MAEFTIYLANKNYSSWSLRGWLMLKQTGAAFDEFVIPLYEPESRPEILRHTPAGKLPTLVHGKVTVWESLAIGEYLAELFPAARLWPKDAASRAQARAISHEMHAGFLPLRQHFPMNMRKTFDRAVNPEAQADIDRITAIWRDCRKTFGAGGDFLFGSFGIADAMYAPVVSRFSTYKVPLDRESEAYAAAVTAWPAYQEWLAAARREPMVIDQYEF